MVYHALIWLSDAGRSGLDWLEPRDVLVREVAPLIVGLILLFMGRSGIVTAAEISALQSGDQVVRLEAQGIDPFLLLVLPRATAFALVSYTLGVVFVLATMAISYVAGNVGGGVRMSLWELLATVLSEMRPADFAVFPIKMLAIGLLVALTSIVTGLGPAAAATQAISCAHFCSRHARGHADQRHAEPGDLDNAIGCSSSRIVAGAGRAFPGFWSQCPLSLRVSAGECVLIEGSDAAQLAAFSDLCSGLVPLRGGNVRFADETGPTCRMIMPPRCAAASAGYSRRAGGCPFSMPRPIFCCPAASHPRRPRRIASDRAGVGAGFWFARLAAGTGRCARGAGSRARRLGACVSR
jgi:hypothetical protein